MENFFYAINQFLPIILLVGAILLFNCYVRRKTDDAEVEKRVGEFMRGFVNELIKGSEYHIDNDITNWHDVGITSKDKKQFVNFHLSSQHKKSVIWSNYDDTGRWESGGEMQFKYCKISPKTSIEDKWNDYKSRQFKSNYIYWKSIKKYL